MWSGILMQKSLLRLHKQKNERETRQTEQPLYGEKSSNNMLFLHKVKNFGVK